VLKGEFMFSKKEWIIFFEGAEAFHTLSHIVIAWAGVLPIHFFFIDWTQHLNMWGIGINAVVTLGLLYWASKLR
jgi:hypothetical protein